MKQCPQCQRTYSDETLTFCLADGALLSAPFDAAETQRIPAARLTNLAPTVVMPAPQTQSATHPGASRTIYIVIAVMSGLIIGLAGIILLPLWKGAQTEKEGAEKNQAAASSNESTKPQAVESAKPQTPAQTDGAAASSAASATLPPAPAELLGKRQGQWSSPRGTVFNTELSLEGAGDGGAVKGLINWTMKSSLQPEKQGNVGRKAVEYVRGRYDATTRTLTLEGYQEDDPDDIIVLDKYRLKLSADNRTISGETWNHGNWQGRFTVSR